MTQYQIETKDGVVLHDSLDRRGAEIWCDYYREHGQDCEIVEQQSEESEQCSS